METAPKVGDIGLTVAENVRRLREERNLSVRALSERLRDLGRPVLPSGVTKIEQGFRRVDVDDLVVLGVALKVSPVELLTRDRNGAANIDEARQMIRAHYATGGDEIDALVGAIRDARVAGLDPSALKFLMEFELFNFDVDRHMEDVAKKKEKRRGKRS